MLSIQLLSTLLLLLLCCFFIDPVKACGGFFCQLAQPVVQSGEAIVFGVKGRTVTMHVQILYEGPAEGFSWVLPVPFQPTVDVGSDRIFTALFQASLPTWQLTIDTVATETCTDDAFGQREPCPPMAFAEAADCPTCSFAMPSAGGGGAVVLEEGSVGPFDFVILEAADNDPSSVFRWLEENGYDQPDESAALLNYYAMNDHKFVALRLQKQAETGEIQPLIMTYEMPADMPQPSPIACVPIQLTRIAATDNMPIQVYILGDVRASPLNFIEMQLDDTQVPWLNCQGNPRCYDDNYRQRFNRAANELLNHSFVTEYAGPANIAANLIEIPVSADDIASVQSERDFFNLYFFSLPTDMDLVDTIIDEHTNNRGQQNASWVFNATLLAQELEEKVLAPAREDQAYLDSFAYLTRLYARLGPTEMTKDPFFAFKPELPDVDRFHRATALPVCTNNIPTSLDITIAGDAPTTVNVPASYDACTGRWSASTDVIVAVGVSPARQLASWGFEGDEGVVVVRSDDGTFDMQLVQDAVAFGDSLVMSQEIPEYSTADGGGGNATDSPAASTDAPTSLAPGSTTQAPSTISETATEPPTAPSPDNIFNPETSTGQPTTPPMATSSSSPAPAPANDTAAPTSVTAPTMAPSLRASSSSARPLGISILLLPILLS